MPKEIVKKLVSSASGLAEDEFVVERPKNPEFGDYAVNAVFGLAKKTGQNPNELAGQIAEKIKSLAGTHFLKIETAGGYINFTLSPDFLRERLREISRDSHFGRQDIGRGQKVIVEYSQPNIAKKMHIGHLRTTVLGDALANIYQALGYKVIRWNYLGDWGTQFGNLIAAYKKWGDKEKVKKNPIDSLLKLYVRFTAEAKTDPALSQTGRDEFKKLEAGDGENKKLWQWFKKESLKEFDRTYKLLGIKFDTDIGESFYEKELSPLVAELLSAGFAEESEGGVIVRLEDFSLPPALIKKSDGASLYLTRDIANLRYRLKKYKPAKILYVVGNEQSLHFQQLLAIAQKIGLTQAELTHIKYGLVLGEEKKKLATREGKAILLDEVIQRAQNLAKEIIEKKSASLSQKEKEEIAIVIAVGALKYEVLKEHRNTDIVFDWQRMLDFSGNSAPYLQYTYARLNNIIAKAGYFSKSDFKEITEKNELVLIKQLMEFPEVLLQCAKNNLSNPLTLFLYELANFANGFYESTPILSDENKKRRDARLGLIETVTKTLKEGLALLGIKTLKRI